jgi:hypothetical protein
MKNETNNNTSPLVIYNNDEFIKDMRVKNVLKHKTNPFVVDNQGQMILDIKEKNTKVFRGKGNELIVDGHTGEVTGATAFYKTEKVDSTQFAKLFVNEIRTLLDLSQTAYKMLLYIMTILKPNKDEIYLFVPDVMEYCQWKSKPAIYRAIKELIQNNIIAPSWKPNIYYINPSILFNGDKLLLVKQYQKDDEWKPDELPSVLPIVGENEEKINDLFNQVDDENR